MLTRFICALNLLFFIISSPSVSGQCLVRGIVQEAEGKNPIPFVNIGIPDATIGTVSDEDGKFILKVPDSLAVVRFSAVGFQTLSVSVQDLLRQPVIYLKAGAINIPVVEITATRLGEDEVLGNRIPSRRWGLGMGSGQLGAEIGTVIRVRQPTLLQEARFGIRDRGADSLLFRVNLYRLEGDLPGERLGPGNILLSSYLQEGELVADLSPYNLVVDEDILLCLEWVKGRQANQVCSKLLPKDKMFPDILVRPVRHHWFEPKKNPGSS
ncbi:carboxypeptidase-like regulatory domain-containing protein [Flavilitoribacter nigricans]|uniref:Carboxypeptidase-like regulatory domain-containing protein n=1 Tax=Flavilitoribacter nigricans (strain ATCC 23147 / DSM 23189 / NBRC 102662 / NCIMB 1420 / SS-2) TaxID=1122177 RepID=A0A2D0N6G6_FLAN2|nr:carboxypeptidase-like regulatory domain-containing protein [Flavilitoribacter nigricans]PHN04057.1 hypothetical protein CRP01_22940 [Flavilitoribacter nigricans DSM 23189 = NBRC 102662]